MRVFFRPIFFGFLKIYSDALDNLCLCPAKKSAGRTIRGGFAFRICIFAEVFFRRRSLADKTKSAPERCGALL
ncbi:MAG: hypothetical protein DBX55_02180 [Verrucomicrobia bacterium]|nr:MAG: hypothetical protein DBX55_02180 [Verrucomicrobiota bacterium]